MLKLKPVRDQIVVRKKEAATQTASGLFLAPSSDSQIVEGEVLAVGDGRVLPDGKMFPNCVTPGQKILFNKQNATEVTVNEEKFHFLRDDHVMSVLEDV